MEMSTLQQHSSCLGQQTNRLIQTKMQQVRFDHSNQSRCKMKDWNWTPLARTIGLLLEAAVVIGLGWVLFVGTWYALGGN